MTNTLYTREEMLAKAKEVFGEEAEVHYSDNEWVISTKCEEKFDPEQYKDRVAYRAYQTWEGNYGTELDRWAVKNGCGSMSMAEIFDEYEAANERNWRSTWEMVVKHVRSGVGFNYEGGLEYRDEVLALGKEQGWNEEDVK